VNSASRKSPTRSEAGATPQRTAGANWRSLALLVVGYLLLHHTWRIGQLDLLFDPLGYTLVLLGAFRRSLLAPSHSSHPSRPFRPSPPASTSVARLTPWLVPLTAAVVALQPRWVEMWYFWAAFVLWSAGSWEVARSAELVLVSVGPAWSARVLRVARLLLTPAVVAAALVYWLTRAQGVLQAPFIGLEAALAVGLLSGFARRRAAQTGSARKHSTDGRSVRRRPAHSQPTRKQSVPAPSASLPRPRRWLKPIPAVLFLTVVLNVVGLWWLLPNIEECYTDPLVKSYILRRHLLPDPQWNKYTYPAMQHRILGAVMVVTERAFDETGFKPTTVIRWSWLYGITRGVSAVMGVVMVAFLAFLIRCLSGSDWVAAAGAFAVATNVEILFRAHTTNVDMGYLMWLAIALWLAARILTHDRLTDWVWLGLLGGLVVTTKDQGGGALVGVALVVLAAGWRHARRAGLARVPALARLARRATLAFLPFAFAFVSVYELTTDTTLFREHLDAVLGHATVPFYEVPATPAGYAALVGKAVTRIVEFSSWPLAALMVFGLGLAAVHGATRRRMLWLALPAVTYFVFALGFARQAPPRQLLPIYILLALFAGWGGVWLAERRGRWRWALRPALALVGALLLWRAVVTDLLFNYESRDRAAAWLAKNLSPRDRLAVLEYWTYQPPIPENVAAGLIERPDEDALRRYNPSHVLLVEQLFAQYVHVERVDAGEPAADGRRWRRNSEEPISRLYERLLNGDLGYRQVARFKVRWPLDPDCVFGLNPEVIILAKSSGQ
jgi:hypothetical protein